jgi:hypothetical protein
LPFAGRRVDAVVMNFPSLHPPSRGCTGPARATNLMAEPRLDLKRKRPRNFNRKWRTQIRAPHTQDRVEDHRLWHRNTTIGLGLWPSLSSKLR